MAGLRPSNYKFNGNGSAVASAAAAAAPAQNVNAGVCPPALGANDPLPNGYVAFARAAVQRRDAARAAAGLAPIGGGCGGLRGKRCVCSGLGCDDLWAQWVQAGCPDAPAAPAPQAAPVPGLRIMGNNENVGLVGNNNESNVSSIHSNNSWNTMAYKTSKQMEKEKGKRHRRNTRRLRRANRRRNTRSRR